MPERRTQSYVITPLLPRSVVDEIAVGVSIRRAQVVDSFRAADEALSRERTRWLADNWDRLGSLPVHRVDPEDPVPELPPSPTFWPRDEPKEPGR